MVLVFLMYALLAMTFSIGKTLVMILPPIFLVATRMILSGILLCGFWMFFYSTQTIKRSDFGLFSTVVLFHILFPYITEFIALQTISPSSACLMYNLSPFLSAFFSYFVFAEKMTPKKWIGFLIGLSGIIFYLDCSSCMQLNISWPNILILSSVATSSLGWIFVRILVKNRNYSTLIVNGLAMLIGGLVALPISYCFEGPINLDSINLLQVASLMGSMILIANVMFYNLYGYLLKKYTATFLAFAGFITPLFAAFFEWMFFGTIVSSRFFLAICIVGGGITLFYQEELKQGYILQS